MLNHSKLSAIVFYVKSLDRTTEFYRDTLGLATNVVPSHEGNFLIAHSGEMMLIFFEGEETPGRTPIVVFGLDGGIDEIVEGLADRGVEIVLPVSPAPGGGFSSDFLDPDGHVLSVFQPEGAPRRKNAGAPAA